MEEEQPKEEQKEEVKPNSIVDEAKIERLKMEEVLKALREENSKAADLAARSALGGQSDAGVTPPKTQEPSDKDYAEAFAAGKLEYNT